MKDLSLTQQYLLCVLNQKGKLPTFGFEKILCLSKAGVLELLMEHTLIYDHKKINCITSLI